MFDVYERERKEKLKEWAEWIDTHEERLERAKERLGERWVLHPANAPKKGRYHELTGDR
jgi:hypothetical protein